jgi:hypothetical protein
VLRRLPIAALGSAAGIALAVLATSAEAWWPEPAPTLVSDAHGSLTTVVVHHDRDFADSSFETLFDLASALDPRTELVVVVEQSAEADALRDALYEAGLDGGPHWTTVATGYPITPWAKDRFGTLRLGPNPALAVPPARTRVTGARGNDDRVPDLLCGYLDGVQCEPLPFFFEGGDLLADERHVFVASNLLARNSIPRAEVVRLIEETSGREAVVLGDGPADVPDHHVGMFVTPLGNGVVAVADPDLGAQLVGERELEASGISMERDDDALGRFHRVAADLEAAGLEVVRVPLLLTDRPRVYVSYNNALLEQRDGERIIYMPIYGIDSLDSAAADVFERQGWHVEPIRVGDLYQHTGSLRCLVGVVERGND